MASNQQLKGIIMKNSLTAILVALTLTASVQAKAGTVRLVSDKWDNISKVQISTGMNAPNSSISTYHNVRKMRYFTGRDKLCYRRSNNPSDPSSGYNNWSCDTRMIPGTKTISLY